MPLLFKLLVVGSSRKIKISLCEICDSSFYHFINVSKLWITIQTKLPVNSLCNNKINALLDNGSDLELHWSTIN